MLKILSVIFSLFVLISCEKNKGHTFVRAQVLEQNRPLFPVKMKDKESFSFIDSDGNLVNGKVFDEVSHYFEGGASVKVGSKWGIVNIDGEFILEPIYDDILYGFKDGFTAVKRGQHWAYISNAGEFLTDFIFDGVTHFSEKRACVEFEGKHGYIDLKGGLTPMTEYSYRGSFYEGLACVWKDGKAGYIDVDGKIVINFQFKGASDFVNGLASVNKNGKWGFINNKGEIVIQPEYDRVGEFNNGFTSVRDFEGDYFYIDTNGIVQIKPEVRMAWDFSEERAKFYNNKKFGYLDRQGNKVIVEKFTKAGDFYNGLAAISIGAKTGYINKDGEWVYFWTSNEKLSTDYDAYFYMIVKR